LEKYEEQFERVKRWYESFKRINEGTSHEKNTEYYHDEVYAFFVNCFPASLLGGWERTRILFAIVFGFPGIALVVLGLWLIRRG
jgi:hypothetical protein